ncbi:MAG TPA: FMN-binding negative transcriptional regulator [Flavobacterium sp.]|nr:FMN-binding negative transcriptional regulator [Flavobacterium sp.]
MYIPDHYKNDDEADIRRFLAENGFGILVGTVNGEPWATHIPMVIETDANGRDFLHGHLSKENPHWHTFSGDTETLAIFMGPHAYVSSSWYDHENVPTWNYVAVHVYGRIRILSEEETLASLTRLVDKYEKGNEHPVRVSELSEKTLRQARGIVGFQLDITRIEAKRKMSQNRDAANYEAVIEHLDASGDPQQQAVAAEMKRKTPFE